MPLKLLPTALLVCALGCTRPVAEPVQPAARPELTFEGLTLRVYRDGSPHLLVRSTHVELMRSTGALRAQNARFDFYVDALTLEAPSLDGNLDALSFDAVGGVTLASSDPDPDSRFVATTSTAHFEGRHGARGVATGTQPITVRGVRSGRPFSLDAQAFRFDVDSQHATFDSVQSKVGAP